MDTILQLTDINKVFNADSDQPRVVLKDLNLEIKENQFVCILGTSGSGKSTILRLISGLEQPTAGQVLYRGRPYTAPSKEIGFVFQDYSLMPWLSMKENIKLGLKFTKIPKDEQDRIVEKYLKMIGLWDFRDAKPHELSGGMQQRVAIARSLANNPDIILMDEPFGALDAFTRIIMQEELLKIWSQDKKTILFVTHSVEEAVFLADRVILLSSNEGQIYEDIDIDIPRPRDRSSQEFNELDKYLLEKYEVLSKRK